MDVAGISAHRRDPLVDRGDGALVLIHPVDEVPKTLLVEDVAPMLGDLLLAHNVRNPNLAFQLKVALHAGEMHFDRHGGYGDTIDLLCRLVDASQPSAGSTVDNMPATFVVSDDT